MNKKFRSLLAVCATSTMLLSATTAPAAYAAGDHIKVERGGVQLQLGQDPILYQDRTFVPLRAIFENIGASVAWDNKTSTVTATKDDVTVQLTIGSNIAYRNGAQIQLDAAPMIRDGRSFVPVRFIAESFNTPVVWDGTTKTVRLKESNRARLEELLQGEEMKITSMHLAGNINIGLNDPSLGKQDLKSKYEMDYSYNQEEDLLNMYTYVKPLGQLAFLFDKLEMYVKDNQVYYLNPEDNTWYTTPLPEEQTGAAKNPAPLTPTELKKLSKYALLDEQDTQDVITFYLDDEALNELDPTGAQETPEGANLPVMKMVIKLDKKTHLLKDFSIDMKIEDSTSKMDLDLHFDGKTSKINEPVTITLSEAAKKAKTADTDDLPTLPL